MKFYNSMLNNNTLINCIFQQELQLYLKFIQICIKVFMRGIWQLFSVILVA